VKTILPLYSSPHGDPETWRRAVSLLSDGDIAVLGPAAKGLAPSEEAACSDALLALTERAAVAVGHVDLARANRPLAKVLFDIDAWSRLPIGGVFFDHAPTSPFAIGFAAIATQAAAHAGLPIVLLNPGKRTDPLYRGLGATICSFEGTWKAYRRWDTAGTHPGDAHLVHDVPMADTDAARDLIAKRGAGCGLVTDWGSPDPYELLPRWAWFAATVCDKPSRKTRDRAALVAGARP